jgi:hypothetical protein
LYAGITTTTFSAVCMAPRYCTVDASSLAVEISRIWAAHRRYPDVAATKIRPRV